MKILITGICGFVGSSLARIWTRAGSEHTLIGVDNLIRPGSHTNMAGLKKLGVKVYHGDLRNACDFETLPPVDVVVDAAANPSVLAGLDGRSSSRQVVEHNLLGTVNMLEYCKQHHAGFILLSTSRVYSIGPLAELGLLLNDGAFAPDPATMPAGLTAEGIAENFPTAAPVSLYGATKLASESLALEYGAAFDIPVWVNRCGVLAGAGQFGHAEQGIFSFWLHSWLRNRPLRYIGFGGLGHQVRDVLHPEDLLTAIEQQLAAPGRGEERIFNLSGGAANALSLGNLSRWCERRWGPRALGADPQGRRYDIPWVVLDSRRAAARWNWRPERSAASILEEIAVFAEAHPDWLDIAAV